MMIIAVLVVGLIGGGAVLFLRSKKDSEEPVKTFDQQPMAAQQRSIAMVQPAAVASAVVQPVVEEPTVLRQWTDESGYTWRAMSDGVNYWWTGTEWQRS